MGDQDQNMAVVRRFYEGYAAGDLVKIKETLADDVTWLIPGHHPLAGLKRGRRRSWPSSTSSARPTSRPRFSP